MIHPTTWHVEAFRGRIYSEVLENQLNQYAHTQIRPLLPRTNLAYVPPSLLRPRAFANDAANDRILGAGDTDHIAPVRRILAASAMPLGTPATGLPPAFAAPSVQHLSEISRYGQCPELPYDSRDFPPRVGISDLRRGRRFAGADPFPLEWDPSLDQTSSRQFRPKGGAEHGGWNEHLHPPMTKARRITGGGGGADSARLFGASASSAAPFHSQPVSTKRYHRPIKPCLPELNKATFLHYMSETQPLLSAHLAGRRRCEMSQWRDELLTRKVDPHAQNPHAPPPKLKNPPMRLAQMARKLQRPATQR